jgi:hypothetical protein
MTTVTAIRAIAVKVFTAEGDADTGKIEYLRALAGDIQAELGGAPRQRSGKAARLSEEERAAHLEAVSKVNERFYGAVTEEARTRAGGGADKAKRLNAMTNWARTALRDVRGYVRAGNDIRALAASKLTRVQLRVKTTPRPLGAAALRRRLVDRGKEAVAAALELIDTDPVAARAELELLMAQLATQLLNLSGRPTKDAQEAASQHIPLRVKSTLFVPTDTQVVRQQSHPS